MTTAFRTILNMSFSASWLILVLIVIRPLLRKLPKSGMVLLWGLVALRLLMPFSVTSRLSLIPDIMQIIVVQVTETIEPGITNPPISVNADINTTVAADIDLMAVLSVIWAVGVLVFAISFLVRYWRLLRRVDTAVLLRENIYHSEMTHASVVVGIFDPKICIPFTVDETNLSHIIAHEKTHIRRGDHWWKLVGYLTLMLHWFNPLVWIAYILLGRDIELACDEAVIRNLSQEGRAEYAQTLVTYSTRTRISNVYPLCFGEVGVKARIKSVMEYKRPAIWHHVLLVVFCVLLGCCFLTNPVKAVENAVQEDVMQETQQPQEENTTRPTKDLPKISHGDDAVKAQIDFMQKQLEYLQLKLIEVRAQYEKTEPQFRPPLKDLMDHYEDRIEELEEHIQQAKKQIGME